MDSSGDSPQTQTQGRPASDDTLVLTVTDLSRGGAGVAREQSGRVLFIPFTAPGDRVRVRLIDSEARYANAELLEVLEPGPQRIQPRCPLFGRCGGCQWQHLPYELQWATKVSGARHALSRTQVPAPERWDEMPAQRIWEYRNRIQLRGLARDIGFFAARSNDLVPADRCEIARPEINSAWEETRAQGLEKPSDRLFKVEVEVLQDGMLRRTWNSGHAASGFRQVHDEQNAVLQNWVGERLSSGFELLDLYGGSGNLSLRIAERMTSVDCVDTGSPSSAPPGTPGHYRFHRSPVLSWILRRAQAEGRTQRGKPRARPSHLPQRSAILDPPRDGMGRDAPEIIAALESLGTTEVVAVGCDPDSWARDVSKFIRRGWRLERIGVIDLFPQTPHIESIAFLKRPH